MKILLYNDTYQHLGGAETYCLELLSILPELGHEVYWLSHGEGENNVEDNHIVLPHYNEGKINYFYSKYFFNFQAYKHIKEQLELIQPDVVHLHHNRYYSFSILKALKETQIPTIQTIHDYTMLCPSQYYPDLYYKNSSSNKIKKDCPLICSHGDCLPWKEKIGHPVAHDRKRKKIIQKVSSFIAPSVQLKKYLERAGFQNVVHLPFFIDEKKWSFNIERENKNVILFVGRVEKNKGIYQLIEAVIELKKEIKDIQLIIAGGGSQVEFIRKKIKEENLISFIDVLGFIDYNEIGKYYNQGNVLVVPSLDMEQFGLIGIEGLASGIAVIGSNRGGIPEWCIHEKTGLLFNPENLEELSQQIKRILLEKGLAKRLTLEGMNYIKKVYNKKQHFEKLIRLYQTAKKVQ